MKDCLITFRSITPAQRAERTLRKAGILGELTRTPKWMEQQGCGYSLRIPMHRAGEAAQLLRQEKVDYRKLYLLRENGKAEEMVL